MSKSGEKVIHLPATISVRDLSEHLQISPIDIIKTLMTNGVMASINQEIDFDTAAIVAAEFGFEAAPEAPPEIAEAEKSADLPLWRRLLAREPKEALKPRPPVIGILGHVDHGKTTLLDAIRHANVAAGEAGGITQHIGAYQVRHNDRLITFIDTPGHAAFTAMRARGAQGADIVVLVVAADDGVMPQTREAIAHARAAQVPIVVALNKIDRPNANPERVKQQLAEIGLVPDEWDGDTLVVPISAKEGTGLDDLLEAILLVADNTGILANPNGKTFGTVIEARQERGRGVVATLLVQNGTLKTGDVVVAGTAQGRIKGMFDYNNKPIKKATPSTPVSVMGLDEIPVAGELFEVVASTREARAIVEERKQRAAEAEASRRRGMTLEQLFAKVEAGETQELRLIVKTDVQGSVEPVTTAIKELETENVGINILHADAGNITENDVMLASTSDAIIIGFNTQPDAAARKLAESEGVSIRTYDIIYRLTEDIEKALKGLLEPEEQEVVIGRANVLAVFQASKVGKAAGCRVVEGEIRRNARVRVRRGDKVLFEGEIASLKRHQDDVREVRSGFECGIGLKGFSDFAEGDVIECFIIETVKPL
ncbi:MAG: translation initiation factor IF-2 [Anaerolineae bacterium]|nr:MAG: translation initiation factor IF-2 [Anaerolineae bacterium]